MTQPLLDPAAELDTVLDEVEHIMNSSDGHVRTEAVPAISDDAKAVVPVPYHPTMKHDEYVKGAHRCCYHVGDLHEWCAWQHSISAQYFWPR